MLLLSRFPAGDPLAACCEVVASSNPLPGDNHFAKGRLANSERPSNDWPHRGRKGDAMHSKESISNEIIMYESEDGTTRLEVQLDGETVWLTQAQIAELFGVNSQAITKHLGNIYEEGELDEKATCSKMEQVRLEGSRTVGRMVKNYNLDAVISVGYRVNSKRATHFRRWATSVLRDYIVKGFALDDDRLKRGDSTYWKELLDRIRDIRDENATCRP